MALHGPHQVAKQSRTTRDSLEPSTTEVWKEGRLRIGLTPEYFFVGLDGAAAAAVASCSRRSLA